MSTQVSPSLLTTYLAAAARQVIDGGELSARSRWAIAHAQAQLRANHDVISEKETFLPPAPSAGFHKRSPEEEPDLAEIVLSAHPGPDEGDMRKDIATEELGGVLTDLQALSEAESEAAAQHVLEIFGARRQGATA